MTDSGAAPGVAAVAKAAIAQQQAWIDRVLLPGAAADRHREAEARAGQALDMKAYHDALLGHGSPPVRVSRQLMFDLPVG